MTDWEDSLPPRVRERLAKAGDLSSEEKERMQYSRELDSLLSRFYRDELDSEGLWVRLRDYAAQGKGYLLRDVQVKLLDSLNLGSSDMDIERRKDGVLAVESVKEDPDTATLEVGLNGISDLRKSYEDELQRAYAQVRAQVERDPRQRVEQVKQGENVGMVQLTVDEAVRRNPQWQEFLAQHEKRYTEEFARLIDRLKLDLR